VHSGNVGIWREGLYAFIYRRAPGDRGMTPGGSVGRNPAQQAKNMPNWSLYNIDHSSFRVRWPTTELDCGVIGYIPLSLKRKDIPMSIGLILIIILIIFLLGGFSGRFGGYGYGYGHGGIGIIGIAVIILVILVVMGRI
jgi:uncharacterized protein DUF3309